MTYVQLTPATTVANTGAVTGAGGDADAAMHDGSDSSYIVLDPDELAWFTLSDLSLPSGAILIVAQARTRAALGSAVPTGTALETSVSYPATGGGTDILTSSATIRNFTPQSYLTSTKWYPTDAGLDGATLVITNRQSGAFPCGLQLFECSLQVLYFVKPTVTVAYPTGTLTEDSSPTVWWTPAWDPDYTPPTYSYRVKVFTDAQYGAGGFDPETSVATLDSGVVTGYPSSDYPTHDFPDTLADDTYRAYVKISPEGLPSEQWSAWDYEGFTINVNTPGVPTLSVTADDTNARVEIAYSATAGEGGTSTNGYELQRYEDGEWVPVRMLAFDETADLYPGAAEDGIIPSGSSGTVWDYEAPNGEVATYRIRSWHRYTSTFAYSDWEQDSVTPAATEWRLKHPTSPALNKVVTLRSFQTQTRAARQSISQPLGRSDAVVISDTRGPETGSITFRADDDETRDYLKVLAGPSMPLLLQAAAGDHEPDRWILLGDEEITRLIDKAWDTNRDATYTFTTIARPTGPVQAWPA